MKQNQTKRGNFGGSEPKEKSEGNNETKLRKHNEDFILT